MNTSKQFFAPEVEFSRVTSSKSKVEAVAATTGTGSVRLLRGVPNNLCGLITSVVLAAGMPCVSDVRLERSILKPDGVGFQQARTSGVRITLGAPLQEPAPVGSAFWSDDLVGEFEDEHPVA